MTDRALYLDRLLYPVTALGPGKRLALWVAGCGRRCPNCANPELWERRAEQKISVDRLLPVLERLLREKKPEGITVTGGEPFEQAAALTALLDGLSGRPRDVLIYSGCLREELLRQPERRALLERAAVLIDGEYRQEENEASLALRGSGNQRIWFQEPGLEARYRAYLRQGRQIQNFVYDYRILSVGIHSPCRRDGTEKRGAGEGEGQEA